MNAPIAACPWASKWMPSGTWNVLLGPYKVGPRGCDYRIEIRLDPGLPPFERDLVRTEVIVDVQIGDQALKIRAAPDVRPAPGSTVALRADAAAVRLFDRSSGAALS